MCCFGHSLTHTRLTALCPWLPGWAGTRKEKPIWILLKQETVSGNGIRWAICQSAPCSSQITAPATHHSFYRPDALPATQPAASDHWRHSQNPIKFSFCFVCSKCCRTWTRRCACVLIQSSADWGLWMKEPNASRHRWQRYYRNSARIRWKQRE